MSCELYGIQTTMRTMGAHTTAIVYLRIVIVQIGSTFLWVEPSMVPPLFFGTKTYGALVPKLWCLCFWRPVLSKTLQG